MADMVRDQTNVRFLVRSGRGIFAPQAMLPSGPPVLHFKTRFSARSRGSFSARNNNMTRFNR